MDSLFNVTTMNEVNIRAFVRNPYHYLSDLPLRVTKRGKTAFFALKDAPKNVTTKDVTTLPNVTTESVKNVVTKLSKASGLCKHGSKIGLCKYGCKK